MFKKKSIFNRTLYIGDKDNFEKFEVDGRVFDYITELKDKIIELKEELKAIKPVVESKDYKPALSEDCRNCIYVVKSSWNNDILGCQKGNVCEDYKPEE